MKVIKSSYEIEPINGLDILRKIEKAGKTCYKTEHTIVKEPGAFSAKNFVKMIIKNGHESVLEHEKVSVRVICDRGVTHEIVRHRIGSYSQESTRYCNYSNDKFGNEITVIDIRKHLVDLIKDKENLDQAIKQWERMMRASEQTYNIMIELGCTPEFARSVLPNSLKTEIAITYNLREWRLFFKQRAVNKRVHPQLREITIPMLEDFQKLIPVVFDDLVVEECKKE